MPAHLSAKEVVTAFLQSLNEENFDNAHSLLSVELKFDGVMGKREDALSYISDMKKMKFKYQVEKMFEEGNDVCVLYNIDMGSSKPIFTCGVYLVEHGKIQRIKVVFDPRPLLEKNPS